MNINLSIAAAPGITNYLIVAVYETTNPAVVVAYQVLPRPLVSSQNITFTGLNSVTHNVFVWENTTATPGGTLKNSFLFDPSYANSTFDVRDDLYLTVGAGVDNPVAGETTFTLASLDGWTYSIERRGFGSMQPGVDVALSDNNKTMALIKTDGGAQDVFGEGEVFILHFEPKVVTGTPIDTFNAGRVFSGTTTLTADTTLTSADWGQSFLIQGASNTIAITLPALNTLPENRFASFISEGGSHKIAFLICSGTDTFIFLGGTPQTLYLGQSERVWIYAAGGVFIVGVADGNFKTVGEVFQSYKNTELNAVFADGSLLNRAQYARLWAWVQTLDATMIVTDTDWNNPALSNKGRFSSGTDSTNFRVPLLCTPGFIRGVDGFLRKAGTFELMELESHNHTIATTNSGSSGADGADPIRGSITGTPNTRGGEGSAKTIGLTGGGETRPSNTGLYLMIRS